MQTATPLPTLAELLQATGPDPRRGSHVSTVRRCMYRKWLPELAKKCHCWTCSERKNA